MAGFTRMIWGSYNLFISQLLWIKWVIMLVIMWNTYMSDGTERLASYLAIDQSLEGVLLIGRGWMWWLLSHIIVTMRIIVIFYIIREYMRAGLAWNKVWIPFHSTYNNTPDVRTSSTVMVGSKEQRRMKIITQKQRIMKKR